jgi:hypothetical protein
VKTSRRERELALRAELAENCFELVDHLATGAASLLIAPRGHPFSVRCQPEEATGDFVPQYVNIETPHRRSSIGYDVDDLCLDIVLDLDGSWALKDSAELDERIGAGIYSAAEGDGIRAAAAKALIHLESRQWPFNGAWRAWRPDPTWQLPQLPADWATGTLTTGA